MKYRGFTLLETIIVLAIMTMFFAISIPFFSRFTESTKLETSARGITSALRTARTYAITNNEDYYVKFDKIVTPSEYYVYHYVPPISSGTLTIVDRKYKLPAGISFYAPKEIGNEIKFTDSSACFKPTGELNETSTDPSVTIADEQTGTANFKKISVEKTTGRARILSNETS